MLSFGKRIYLCCSLSYFYLRLTIHIWHFMFGVCFQIRKSSILGQSLSYSITLIDCVPQSTNADYFTLWYN